MPGGVQRRELEIFGESLERILKEAKAAKVIEAVGSSSYTSRPHRGRDDPWAIGNMRSFEQDPYVICKAPLGKQGPCSADANGLCPELRPGDGSEREPCEHLVQLIDRQYVYRDAHPNAIFEDRDGYLYRISSLDCL